MTAPIVPDAPGWWWRARGGQSEPVMIVTRVAGASTGKLVWDKYDHSIVEDDGTWRGPCVPPGAVGLPPEDAPTSGNRGEIMTKSDTTIGGEPSGWIANMHPSQPIVLDEHGTARFKVNPVVRWLLDDGGLDLNQMAMKRFDPADVRQVLQQIGYSVSGYGDTQAGCSDPRLDEYDAAVDAMVGGVERGLKPPEWVTRAPNVFDAEIGAYEATVSDSGAGGCWRWSLRQASTLDPKVDAAFGFFVGDADGAKRRAEEIAGVLMQLMELPPDTAEQGSAPISMPPEGKATTDAEQSWLDETPVGDRRVVSRTAGELTLSLACDRRKAVDIAAIRSVIEDIDIACFDCSAGWVESLREAIGDSEETP